MIQTAKRKFQFQSYQFRQINPDIYHGRQVVKTVIDVSIVSIQADQSRPVLYLMIQFNLKRFQSYQFRQINPDQISYHKKHKSNSCFNRINSGRSIPTSSRMNWTEQMMNCFNRINSCRSIPTWNSGMLHYDCIRSFNRINSCRSIPTW